MAPTRGTAEAVLACPRSDMRKGNIYCGRVVSLEVSNPGVEVRFHRLPAGCRGGIVPSAGGPGRGGRQGGPVSRFADELRASGRHLKRGLLLYGPPGTGKTLTAKYLAGRTPGRTVSPNRSASRRLVRPCGRRRSWRHWTARTRPGASCVRASTCSAQP